MGPHGAYTDIGSLILMSMFAPSMLVIAAPVVAGTELQPVRQQSEARAAHTTGSATSNSNSFKVASEVSPSGVVTMEDTAQGPVLPGLMRRQKVATRHEEEQGPGPEMVDASNTVHQDLSQALPLINEDVHTESYVLHQVDGSPLMPTYGELPPSGKQPDPVLPPEGIRKQEQQHPHSSYGRHHKKEKEQPLSPHRQPPPSRRQPQKPPPYGQPQKQSHHSPSYSPKRRR